MSNFIYLASRVAKLGLKMLLRYKKIILYSIFRVI